jgi:hypothetical protein
MTTDTRPGGWRERLAIAAPPLLLVTVAVTQMVLALTLHLSPWKGGGFGMFASVDGLPFRSVRIEVSAVDRSEQLAVPPSLTRLADAAATLPSRRSLERLADGVIARERRHGRAVDRVRVEVWRADYSSSLEAVWTRVAGLSVTANETAARVDWRPD